MLTIVDMFSSTGRMEKKGVFVGIEDQIFEKVKSKGGNPFMVWVVLGLIVFVLASVGSTFYSIEPNEVGVIRRFGKFIRITEPGLHFKLPLGIEKLNRVKVEYIFKEEFGFRTVSSGVKSRYSTKSFDDESLMLTGDLNVLDVEWIVQFKVKDPVKYLFNVRNSQKTLRDVSESVMRAMIGDYAFNEALTEKRIEINNKTQQKMQVILDDFNSGVEVVTVKLQDVNPPRPVQPAFNEVNSAKQEMEKMVNQAWQVYNQQIPAAKGEALKMVSQAEGYSQETVNRADGDAQRFTQLLEAYKNAKEITKKRMYLDKMKDVIKRSGKIYVIDPEVEGLLPMLNLSEVK